MADTAVLDIDAKAAEFQPLVIRFRAQEWTLGKDIVSLLTAATFAADGEDEESDGEVGQLTMLAKLKPVLRILAPGIPVDDLSPGEEVALLRAVTEVMNRCGRLTFSEE